jgi:hypothetical protein
MDENAEDLKRLGERLKSLREAQGFSLDDVSNMTHVRPHVIQAIEDGRVDRVSAPVYVRGFVKTYCECLMADDLWKRYSPILPSTDISGLVNTGGSSESIDIKHPTPMFRRSSIIWVYIILVTAVLAAACLLWDQYNDPNQGEMAFFLRSSEATSDDVEAILPEVPPMNEVTSASSDLSARAVSLDAPPSVSAAAPLSGLIASPASFDLSWMDGPVSASARPVAGLPQIRDRNLLVEITGPNRLTVLRGEKMLTRRDMGAGGRRTYDVYADTRVTLSAGNRARITWQGKRYDSIGGDGNPIELIFRPDGTASAVAGNVPYFETGNAAQRILDR